MKNKKGFTLAELLVVVAIIGVLAAISIPVFTAQTKKANQAVDNANVRAAYAEVVAYAMANTTPTKKKVTISEDWDNTAIGSASVTAWKKDTALYVWVFCEDDGTGATVDQTGPTDSGTKVYKDITTSN